MRYHTTIAMSSPIILTLTSAMCGYRLDKVIATLLPQYSRSRIQQWCQAGYVHVAGYPALGKKIVYGDEKVEVFAQLAPEEMAFHPEPLALSVVEVDPVFIVLNKPTGLVVHPAAGNWSGTLLNGLLHQWPELRYLPRAGIVHRLDKDTSGLMVVARTLQAQTDLVQQLQAHTVKRIYIALVWGITSLTGAIHYPIGRHQVDRIKMAALKTTANASHAHAKPAVTHYDRLATGQLYNQPVSLLLCRLETGRTHQIRVHMQSIGHPLVGDVLYGRSGHTCSAIDASIFPHQALHAFYLGLKHPIDHQIQSWTAPVPEGLKNLLHQAQLPFEHIKLMEKIL